MEQKLTEEDIEEIISSYSEYIGDSWIGNWGISSDNIREFARELLQKELELHSLTNDEADTRLRL